MSNFYRNNQILSDLYTSGNELVTSEFENYIGFYHRLPDNTIWSESFPDQNSIELFERTLYEYDKYVTDYKKSLTQKLNNYIDPVPYYPMVTSIDYEYPILERYFVKNVNTNDIIEVDNSQYRSVNIRNILGIDGLLWKKGFILWNLYKEVAITENKKNVDMLETKFKGIKKYLTNYLEFTI